GKLRPNSTIVDWIDWWDAVQAVGWIALLGVVLTMIPTLVCTRKCLNVGPCGFTVASFKTSPSERRQTPRGSQLPRHHAAALPGGRGRVRRGLGTGRHAQRPRGRPQAQEAPGRATSEGGQGRPGGLLA